MERKSSQYFRDLMVWQKVHQFVLFTFNTLIRSLLTPISTAESFLASPL